MYKITGGIRRALHDSRRLLSDWELRGFFVLGVILIVIGMIFYMNVEDWDPVQAFYFCVTTLTTVGYGDLHPTSDLSRVFTAFYIIVGVGFILGFANTAARKAIAPIAERLARRHDDR